MKGYQRAVRPRQAATLAEIEREDAPKWRKTHREREEGGSLCIYGRNSHQLTDDPALVTCKSCRKLMEGKQ